MLSRVADAIYWMGRYLERAENVTRLLLVTEDFSTETQGLDESVAQTAWKDLLAMLPTAQLTRPVSAFAPLSLPYLTSFFLDAQNAYSIHFSLRKARENARSVREALTIEAFMSINETFRAVEALDFLELAGPVRLTPALRAAHRAMAPSRAATLGEHVLALGAAIAGRFEYQKDVTKYDSTTEDFLRIGGGVCQDFTHLMLGLLRLSGIPCRYVSGYLHVERKKREPSQSHAWVEVYAPSAGWIPFDPTHNRAVDERYVVVGHGRHYDDVPPNKGIYRGGARETLRAEVYTQGTTAKAIPRLSEEVRPIDLQVFAAAPQRRPEVAMTASADDQSQQQQQ
jgi:transglutaminase-like putative cysteine protease